MALATLLAVAGCGGSSFAPLPPAPAPPGPEEPPPDEVSVEPPATSPDLLAFEPFNYDDTSYPGGLHGQEGGFGFAHPWNDADDDVMDRVVGGHELAVTSDLAPPSTGGRSIHWNTSGSAIYRDLDRTYGTDGTTVWVSYRWITTDTAVDEWLQVVDFNRMDAQFGLVVGQVRGLADDDLGDGMYDVGHHPSRVSADVGVRDAQVHFVLLRFRFGAADADEVAAWWDPDSGTFSEASPTATVAATDTSFNRVTLRSGAADSVDELRIGTTLASVTQPSQRMAVYRVGNSLTWDSQPEAIEALAGQRSYLHDEGFHVRCGQTLENIWAEPADTCIDPVVEYGRFDAALPNHDWDAVTLQPFPGGTSTLLDDENVVLDFIALTRQNAANADTRYYVYGAWPERNDFTADWIQPVVDDDATPTVMARAYFAHLVERVRARTEAHVYVIPVGEALYELDQRLQAGQVPGLTSVADLYRDDVHLSHDLGRFVAGLTVFSTLYAQDPTGIVKPESYYGDPAAFTPAFYAAVYDAVWSAVAGHPHTGIAP